jgi:hypothetical protein
MIKLYHAALVGFLLTTPSAFSQIYTASSYLTDFNGTLIKPGKANNDVMGTTFLNELWSRGKVVNLQGKEFEVEKMRFNIAQNRIEYEVNGQAYELTIPYRAFSISESTDDGSMIDRNFKNNFPSVETQSEKTFYEIVYDGDAKLLRHYKIRVNEYAEYGSMVRTKRFTKVSSLYIYHPNKKTLTKISKKKQDLLEVFDDKKEAVEQFMRDSKIKKNISESEVVTLCKFYDSQK